MSKDEVPVVQLRKKKPAKKAAVADEGESVVPLRKKKVAAEVSTEGEPVVSLRRKKTAEVASEAPVEGEPVVSFGRKKKAAETVSAAEMPVEEGVPVVAMGRKKKAKAAGMQTDYGAQANYNAPVAQNYTSYDAQAYGAQANYTYDAYGNPVPVQKKSSKLWLVITLIIAGVILAAAGVVILLLVINNNKDGKKEESSQTVTTSGIEWGDKFASYLASMSDAVGKSVLFYESQVLDDPAMLLFKKDNSGFAIELYGIKSGKVEKVGEYGFYGDEVDEELKFMYDVDKEEYNYFISTSGSDGYDAQYISLDSYIIEQEVNEKNPNKDADELEEEYKKNEHYANYSQNNTELNSGEEVHVIDTGKKVEAIEYKSEEQLLKEIADKYAAEIIKNSELGKEYDTEIQTKVETVKKAQENAGIKIGNYTVKYGKYKIGNWMDDGYTNTVELKPDGVAIKDNKKAYWRVEKHNFAQGVEDSKSGKYNYPAIIISDTKDGVGTWFTPYMAAGSADLSDGGIWYLQKIADTTSSTGNSNSGDCASWLTCKGNSFLVGSYTVEFGTYEVKDPGSHVVEEFILGKDGTAVYDGEEMYFRVGNYDFTQSEGGSNVKMAVIFSKTKDGPVKTAYTPYDTYACALANGIFCADLKKY